VCRDTTILPKYLCQIQKVELAWALGFHNSCWFGLTQFFSILFTELDQKNCATVVRGSVELNATIVSAK
jgi:hypothetical protein